MKQTYIIIILRNGYLYFAEFETNISLSDLAYEAGNMPNRNETFRMENFTYQNDVVMETMFKHLEETDFLGVSVSV